ncbi:MAG: hypothetical protein L0287_37495, partial [Anaerolineae bacterium]|nr:hypothetical protein [Anaerolineae bacterium]
MKRNYLLFLLASLITLPCDLPAQDVIVVSSNPGPGLRIALSWPATTNAVAYNIFRKNQSDPAYPLTPINPLPVQPAQNCFVIKSLLINAMDSSLWKTVARALSDSVLFDPCNIVTMPKTSEKYQRLLAMARGNMRIAKVTGTGYEDNTVVSGTSYHYRIVALD